MALFNGDLSAERLRSEHRMFRQRRDNRAESSTLASVYTGSWFSMASLDGIELEDRNAENTFRRRDYEVK